MLRLLPAAALSLLLLVAVPAAQADPIEVVPGPETTLVDTCTVGAALAPVIAPGVVPPLPAPVAYGAEVVYQPYYYGTFDPLPHADGVLLTLGAETHPCGAATPGPKTTLVDTCMFTAGVGPVPLVGFQVYIQPYYFGTSEPLPHADGVILTAGADERPC